MKMLKAVTLDLDPIIQAMRDLSRTSSEYYLHRSSGKVVALSRHLIQSLEREDARDKDDLPAWEAPLVPLARQIILKGSPDFIRIPESYGMPEHAWMAEFVGTMKSGKTKTNLNAALRGRGSCKRFKEILCDHADDSRRWKKFAADHWKEKAQCWLEGIGILGVAGKSSTRPSPKED